MSGMNALAFITSEQTKLREMISSVSTSIERPGSDHDTGHNGYVSKKRVKTIMEAVYKSVDNAARAVSECEKLLIVLREGSEEEIDSLNINDEAVAELRQRADLIENGNARLRYAFFVIQSDPAWHPHITTLHHLQARLTPGFERYVSLVREIADTAEHYIPREDGLAFNLAQMEESIKSATVKNPDWVKSSDDFVRWIRESK